MDHKNFTMGNNFQAGLHNSNSGKHHNSQQPGKLHGAAVYHINGNNNSKKMGQIIALKLINIICGSVAAFAFISNGLAFVTNIGNYANGAISFALGVLACVWGYWRIREKRADARMKEIDMEDAEDAHIEKRKIAHKK